MSRFIQHIPDRGEHLVRYYCWYSNRSRGEGSESGSTTMEDEIEANGRLDSDTDNPGSEYIKDARSAWARLIKKIYEVAPLICHHCGGEMRFTRHIPMARPSGQLKLFKINPGDFSGSYRGSPDHRAESS